MDRDKRLIACFVPIFNAWAERSYEVVAWPDVEQRNAKAVDALARDPSGCLLAIEHTLLQPFAGDRADTVPFLTTAGRLDRRTDLAEPGWMINLVFPVGAIPKGVDWASVGRDLEDWFVDVRPRLIEGRNVCEVKGLPFDLNVIVVKAPLPGTAGKLFVTRRMPDESVEEVLRAALASKVPKLAAEAADERILLLEMNSLVRGYWGNRRGN